ncbi:glutamate-5-semialdehyde dehydrogenase [Roseisolibacter sp. H3M3-2]|uniref:glutamate-5-semialdehyde dehydrogenase n=1 Tax=Roseisolibacter sp. H3M3-2 TaxID=3031323 RepID=UPI0023DBE60A|nr:glutamate-5-semialdehyde dehydrogenase [Roseisolibacter sp. H3M3-2]MDF1502100.1 glutamate-5-semialdehyde dehydrogenase [Roseisolibacter sp. H3M3-2]
MSAAATVRALAERAKAASRTVAARPAASRAAALRAVPDLLLGARDALLSANAVDLADAREALAAGAMSRSTYQRLVLDDRRLDEMAAQLRAVAAQPEPLGRVLRRTLLDDGLELRQVSCPIGVVAAIFEARPDAVTQIAALALRSGNAVVLKPGREVRRTARALVDAMHGALAAHGAVPCDAVAMVDDRAAVDVLLSLDDLVDLVVPRGSNALVRDVMARSRIPVLGHAEGVCHLYLDAAAEPEMALALAVDAKVQYPAACNAVEVVLVHRDVADALIPPLVARLRANGVTVGGCRRTRALVPDVLPAAPADWRTEWGDLRLTVGVVDDVDDAIAHVNAHGSHHTDAIVTSDAAAAEAFLARVDSACVFHNASTRFADGYRFGLGAELGIGTGKLHARGPVGLEGLTTYKHVLAGSGQRVADYVGPDARAFRHAPLAPG